MTVQSGQLIVVTFTTRRFDTGVRTNADSLPTATLRINGANNAAVVTVTNDTTGEYHASVVLPTLSIDQIAEIVVTATVNSVTDQAVIWRDSADLLVDNAGKTTDSVQTGDSYARIGATGSGLTTLAPSATALSTATWTAPRAVALDNLDASVNSRLATSGYTAPLTASTTRAALGMASNNLDTQLTGLFTAITATASATVAPTWWAAPPAVSDIAAAILVTPAHLLLTDAAGRVELTSAGIDQVSGGPSGNLRQVIVMYAGVSLGTDTATSAVDFKWTIPGGTDVLVEATLVGGKRTDVILHPPA